MKTFYTYLNLFSLVVGLCTFSCKEKASTPATKEREEISKEMETSADSSAEDNEEMEEVEIAGGSN